MGRGCVIGCAIASVTRSYKGATEEKLLECFVCLNNCRKQVAFETNEIQSKQKDQRRPLNGHTATRTDEKVVLYVWTWQTTTLRGFELGGRGEVSSASV